MTLASAATSDKTETLVALLAANPNHAEAQKALYELCLPDAQTKGMQASIINRLIEANPEAFGLRSVALMICRKLEDREDRIRHLEALHHRVSDELYYKEYTLMLKESGQFERCVELCDEAITAYPAAIGMRKMRAEMYLALGQHNKALQDWAWILTQTPEDHETRISIGIAKLLMSNGKEGYAEYGVQSDIALANYKLLGAMPQWRGKPLKGKHLLLCYTQGIGDVIMCASLLPWVLAQGAQVTLAMLSKLRPLFARSFPGIRIVPFTNRILKDYSECDFYTVLDQLMPYALPHYTPSQHPPFLKADAARASALRKKYLALSPMHPKKLVGISWHTKNDKTSLQRNISLKQWRPLFDLPHVQPVSLQYGDHRTEIEAINRAFPGAVLVDPEIDAYGDADGLAAQIAACDEVVSIQNTTVHLAGALGVKTTLMLSAASDWRWGLKRTDNRWYESVHIERQEKLLHWTPVLARVRERLIAEASA